MEMEEKMMEITISISFIVILPPVISSSSPPHSYIIFFLWMLYFIYIYENERLRI